MMHRVRLLLGLALPAVGTLIADPLMGLVDTAIVGRMGASELGGLGLAVALLSTVSWVFNFLVYSTTSSIAIALGAGDGAGLQRRLRATLQVAGVIGVLVGGFLWFSAEVLLQSLGAVEAVAGAGAEYLRVRALGIPFLMLAFIGHGVFRGYSDTRTPLYIAVGANVINAVLTVALAPRFGIAGVAAGTLLAEVAAVVAFVFLLPRIGIDRTYLVRRQLSETIATDPNGRSGISEILALLRSGRDLFLRTGALTLGYLAVTSAASRLGIITAAAHQVIFQTMVLGSFLLDGLAVAGQTTVGNALGRGDVREAAALGRTTAVLGAVSGTATGVVLLAVSDFGPRLLTDDPAVLRTVETAWWLFAAGHVVSGIVFALDGVLMGAEDYAFLRNVTVGSAVVGGVGAQFVASADGTLVGLWWCITSLMLLRCIGMVVRVRGSAWIRTVARTPTRI